MVGSGVRKRVLITGASGLIGRAVTENLIARNRYEIKVQVRDAARTRAAIGKDIDFTKVAMEEGDFTRMGEREMTKLTRGAHIIIHAAGLAHTRDLPYQEYEVVNVRATQALIEAAAQNGVETFVFLSSSAVYGPGPFESITETAQLRGVTPYAVSKMASEQILANCQTIPRIIVLRPSLVFGEGDRGNLLSLIRSVKEQKYKHVGGGQAAKSLIYSKDLAHAIRLLLDSAAPGLQVFNLSNPEPVTVRHLTEEIAACLGLPNKISSVPTGLLMWGAKAAELLMSREAPITADQVTKLTTTTTCSISKLVTATGFQPPTSLNLALQAEIRWAKAHSLL